MLRLLLLIGVLFAVNVAIFLAAVALDWRNR